MHKHVLKLKFKHVIKRGLIFTCLFLSGCVTAPPGDQSNICNIFQQYPKWYWSTRDSYIKWQVPISVQMAIIKQESSFVANARPPRSTLLGFIPWSRPTTAFGYAQATDSTWGHYVDETGNTSADRDNFADAADFIGWYAERARKRAGISKSNAYQLYLAYHEGIGGYMRGTYRNKQWLIDVAKKVQKTANTYRWQLSRCKDSIPKPSMWNLWLV